MTDRQQPGALRLAWGQRPMSAHQEATVTLLIQAQSENEKLRAELEALRKQEPVAWAEMLADAREVFDANGSETPQVVRDVIEYIASWGDVYADKSRAAGAQPAPSVPGRATMIERLKAAVEGECDGLAIDDRHAEAILDYVLAAELEAPEAHEATKPAPSAPNPSDFSVYQPPWSRSDITILRAIARAVEATHGIKE